MYSLLSRIPEGLRLLHRRFEEHVTTAGLAAVAKLVGHGDVAAAELVRVSLQLYEITSEDNDGRNPKLMWTLSLRCIRSTERRSIGAFAARLVSSIFSTRYGSHFFDFCHILPK